LASLGRFLAARRSWVLGFWIAVLAATGATLAPAGLRNTAGIITALGIRVRKGGFT
jgi:hypothetical protein